ncbi:CBS domain-containing protein [Streptomyces sp. NPDC087844]|uniref:CBS domain-containing protein n=1 Tax=Streptomyces sp. NPDC087844 TaxID=3365805 RepID=UPI00381DC6AC
MSVPPVTVYADDTSSEAARIMARDRAQRLPVLGEEDRLVGIVTRRARSRSSCGPAMTAAAR